MSTTTRRQFLTTLGTAAVAVPLAAALPGVASPKVAAAAPQPPIVALKPVEWHIRYASNCPLPDWPLNTALRIGECVRTGLSHEPMLIVTSQFGTDPIVRDFFSYKGAARQFGTDPAVRDFSSYEGFVMEEDAQIDLYKGAVWLAQEVIRSADDRSLTKRDIKVQGDLRVKAVKWKETPGEWMSTICYVVDWQTLAKTPPNWDPSVPFARFNIHHSPSFTS